MHRLLVLLAVSVTFWGCATASRDRGWLAQSVRARTGHALGPATSEGRAAMPLGVSVADGLSADDAVAIALWRSPALQAELTALDTALADFDEASRPANPRINLLAPIDPRQLSAILFLPIEAIWQTPYRAAAANRELERVSESMIHVVLNVERDVRIAHVDAYLAMRRVRAYEPLVATWSDAAPRRGAGESWRHCACTGIRRACRSLACDGRATTLFARRSGRQCSLARTDRGAVAERPYARSCARQHEPCFSVRVAHASDAPARGLTRSGTCDSRSGSARPMGARTCADSRCDD
ncbi:MAG: hypothetical protein IPK60_03295 [Sandaracinaceae bacterium]|nr:hypothetical protein [Sandaracinaceae bacterium]